MLYAGTERGVFVFKHDEPPTADAGPDQFVKATGNEGEVTLDGSRSSDPEGESLSLAWTWPAGQATGVHPTIRLPLGTTDVSLTVTDSDGSTATDTVQVTVCHGQSPHAWADCKPARGRP